MGRQCDTFSVDMAPMGTHLQVEREAVRGEVRVVDLVLESKALTDEELEREDVLGFRVDLGREGVDRDGVVLRFGGEEDAGKPGPVEGSFRLCLDQGNL